MKLAFSVFTFRYKIYYGEGAVDGRLYLGTRSDDDDNDNVVSGVRRSLLIDFSLPFFLFLLSLES